MKNLTIIETILRNRYEFFKEIRESIQLPTKIRAMLISCFVFLAIYGVVMGASHSWQQAVTSALKVPVLFLATLLICIPSLHYFNLLFGSKQTIQQTIALILTAISTSSVLLFSLASITLFFLLTSSEYHFFKLLNVTFFAVSGFLGVIFLRQGMKTVTEAEGEEGIATRRFVFLIWVVLYGFVGSQMAWTLSPFIGDPTKPFILFRQIGGNFYSDVLQSLGVLLGFE